MDRKTNIVHVTHEAIGKIGGIGAVLDGILTSKAYLDNTGRTILVSTLFSTEGPVENRLGIGGEVLYSSSDGLAKTGYTAGFKNIERHFNVDIVYGRRLFEDRRTGIKSMPEVILIDVRQINVAPINHFKGQLFHKFGIVSQQYERLWEYDEWVRLAPPAIAALKVIGAAPQDGVAIVVAHEFMGLPTALAAKMDDQHNFKTVFYAHEVASVRKIVEERNGHDTMFYNVMKAAQAKNISLPEVFGDQSGYFKNALVEASRYCDSILAVGDYVADELRFLTSEFRTADIELTYNGIPAYHISLEEKKQSKAKLVQYCKNLLGFRPDYIFTHVTRLVKSKGLWRDLRVLEHIEKELRPLHKSAVMFLLSTEVGPRRLKDILKMESEYQWPVAHREGLPDLSGGEATFYTAVQEFNTRSRNIKMIFINQFGFDRHRCGHRMPEDMEFMDIRKGSDVEFGQSIYEPFGIAQIEPLSFGGICVLSSACGCTGFIRRISGFEEKRNVIIADYTNLDGMKFDSVEDMLKIDINVRNQIEHFVSEKVALEIFARLPKNDDETVEMIRSGYDLAEHMSWEEVVKNYVLKAFGNAVERQKLKTAV
jgi:glycosyltransferase involved in cell wall biosynthesis